MWRNGLRYSGWSWTLVQAAHCTKSPPPPANPGEEELGSQLRPLRGGGFF